jgi:isochorismate pyruvate lyase
MVKRHRMVSESSNRRDNWVSVGSAGYVSSRPRIQLPVVSIDEVRSHIDGIDEQIVKLLAARQKLVKKAARYKTDEQAVRAPDRRAAMMERRRELALREGVSPEVVCRVYDAMIDGFIDLELQEHSRINLVE